MKKIIYTALLVGVVAFLGISEANAGTVAIQRDAPASGVYFSHPSHWGCPDSYCWANADLYAGTMEAAWVVSSQAKDVRWGGNWIPWLYTEGRCDNGSYVYATPYEVDDYGYNVSGSCATLYGSTMDWGRAEIRHWALW